MPGEKKIKKEIKKSKKELTIQKDKEVKKKVDYNAKDIYVLKGLEPVRKRPGMYIGSTGTDGLHHLIWECVDNSLDEAIAGYASQVEVDLLPGNRVRTRDDGRGIPTDKHPQTGKSALETVMTTLHAGAKFGGKAYQVAGGLHGVGVSVVCALSSYLRAEVCRDGIKYVQEYAKGDVKTKVKKEGKCERNGTTVIFEPDPEIFSETNFNFDRILKHLRQQAYLTKGAKVIVRDLRDEDSEKHLSYTFYFDGGLASYVRYLIKESKPKHDKTFYTLNEIDGAIVEVAFRYTEERECFEESFANNIYTGEGGTHLTGLRAALTRTLNDYARKEGYFKDSDNNLSGQDVREGFTGVVSVKIENPQFEGQTKARLGNPEVKIAVERTMAMGLADFLERNPRDARAIIESCLLSKKARDAARAAKQTVIRKGVLGGLTLPGKLADCSSRKPEESELYIVEGDSAAGSSKQGRDRRFQAILPLKGKILNVERARLDRILSSKEIKSLIIALGTAISEDFDLEKLRYHRIIIMTDADVDGAHIRTLLLTFFYRYFQPIIENGHLFIAQPPLYRVQAGKQIEYAYAEADKSEIIENMKKNNQNPSVQRYKGLGEMNPDQLWETTMNPENRTLLKVTIGDAQAADHIFDTLMGKEVFPRKRFIQTHAKAVKNLDV
jgi:DNA gyrase subunit B